MSIEELHKSAEIESIDEFMTRMLASAYKITIIHSFEKLEIIKCMNYLFESDVAYLNIFYQ